MAGAPDKLRIVAEALCGLVTTGGAAIATAAGVPAPIPAVAKGMLDGLFKLSMVHFSAKPDPQQIVARIQDKRTANTIETIRDALVVAMELKPEFEEPIDELADAVLARQDGRDESRFQEALLKLCRSVIQASAKLEDIKADTSQISSIKDDTSRIYEEVKRIGAAVTPTPAAGPADGGVPQQAHLRARVDDLTTEVRALRDDEGRGKWDKLNAALSERSWDDVFKLSRDLEQWLEDQGEKISSDVKGQALLSLADVALIRDSGFPFENRDDTAEAWRLLRKAEAVFGGGPSPENAHRCLRVRAKLTFVDGDREKAWELVNQTAGAGTVSLKIAFFQEGGLWEKASDLAAEQSVPEAKWADDAVVAHLRAGHDDRARALVEWAKDQDEKVRQACKLAYLRTRYSLIIKDGEAGALLHLTESDLAGLRDLQRMTAGTFATALLNGPRSGVEAEALELAILLGHVLHDAPACQAAANQLAKWHPLSPELGRAELRHDIAPITGLADRYCAEHPRAILCQMLAAMLYTEIEGDGARALSVLSPLLATAEDADQKNEIGTGILIAAQACGADDILRAKEMLEKEFGCDHRLPTMLRALLLARQDEFAAANVELGKVADEADYIWLQFAAGIAAQLKDWQTAAERSRKVGELTGNADAFVNEANSWYRAGDLPKAVLALERVQEVAADRPATLWNLGALYHRLNRHDKAAEVYRKLWQQGPHEERLARSYASCLALSGRSGHDKQSVQVLDEFIAEAGNALRAEPVMMRAQLLLSQGDPVKALGSVLPHWEQFSSDFRYLLQVVQLGYAANREDEASRAFARLVEMQGKGTLPQQILQRFSLEEVVEMHKRWREGTQTVNQQYLSGRLPWIVASRWAYRSGYCYLSWLIRTQPLIPRDHPDDLAEYSVYATNGFTVGQVDSTRHLVRLCVPDPAGTVVADMSALITLHRLGLLDSMSKCFDRVLVPASYKAIWLEEQSRIPHHQPRQIASRQAVVSAAREGRITGVAEKDQDAAIAILDEYKQDASGTRPVVRILQVARWLAREGKLAAADLARVEAMHHQTPLVPGEQVELALRQGKLLAAAFTLRTVHDWGLLESMLGGLKVMVDKAELQELESELRGQRLCDEAGRWHVQLVQTLNGMANVEFVAGPVADDAEEATSEIHYGADAALIAVERGLPLLVDDRYCQQGRLSASPQHTDTAFGTDIFLERMAAKGDLAPEAHGNAVLQLMRWRYKFVIPTVEVLLTFANQFKAGLPGSHLRETAAYMQDCMRDLGLYGGPEQTEPPTPMALKLFMAWLNVVGEFVAEFWQDPRFTESEAARLTTWVARHFLPSWPKNLGAPSWRTVAQVTTYAFLGTVMMRLLADVDADRAHRIVRRIRRSLGVTAKDMAETVGAESASMADALSQLGSTAIGTTFVRLIRIAYGERAAIDWRLLPLAESLKLVAAAGSSEEVPPDFLAAIANRSHPRRVEPKRGPFAYVVDEKKIIASYLPDMLCAPASAVRHAVIDDLLPDEHCPKSRMVGQALRAAKDAICSDAASSWVPAVSSILDAVEEDIQLNAAGFLQGRACKHDEAIAKCWRPLIRPTAEALLSIDRDAWDLLQDSQPGGQLHAALMKLPDLAHLIAEYDRLVGHLCLASPRDLGTMIREFMDSRTGKDNIWDALQPWLNDKPRPWRRYHACQALLANPDSVPHEAMPELWSAVAEITGVLQAEQHETDAAQIWQLERELAAHYLRVLDVSGYALHEDRHLTISWWAARRITEVLITGLSHEALPEQIRQWREGPLQSGASLAHNAWAWLSPRAYSPARFATLYAGSPRSLAMLGTIGVFAKAHGLQGVPKDVRERLRDTFCAALLTVEAHGALDRTRTWAWDEPLIEAAEAFFSALPAEEQTDAAAQVLDVVKRLTQPDEMKEALLRLPKAEMVEAVFICSRARLYCYEHNDAGDLLLERLRDTEWRTLCANALPLRGWELLTQGLLFLQSRQGMEWAVDLPYVLMRAAEAVANDQERAGFFLMCTVMSSLSSNTAGAIKLLGRSEQLLALRPAIDAIRSAVDELRRAATPAVAIRLRGICSLLDQLR